MRNIIRLCLILWLATNRVSVFASARTETLQAFSAIGGDITGGHVSPASFGGGMGLASTYRMSAEDGLLISSAISLLPAHHLLSIGGSFDYANLDEFLTSSTYRQTTTLRNRDGTLRIGLNINYHQRSSEQQSDSYLSFDTGFLIMVPPNYSIGAAISNLFNTATEDDRGDPFGRVGLSYRMVRWPRGGVYVLADFGFTINKNGENYEAKWNRFFTGTEIVYQRFLILRAGIRYENLLSELALEEPAGLNKYTFYTLGGGLRLGPLELDYGYKKFREFDEEHIVTAQLKFSTSPHKRNKEPKPKPSLPTQPKPVKSSPLSMPKQDKETFDEPSEETIQANYKKHLRDGILAVARMDYQTAIQYWKAALLWEVSSERTLRGQISNAYAKWLNSEFEMPKQKQSVKNQQSAWERLIRGYRYYLESNYELAIQTLSGSLQLDSTLTEAYKWLGCAHVLIDNEGEAKAAFRQALAQKPDLILIGDVPEEVRRLFGRLKM